MPVRFVLHATLAALMLASGAAAQTLQLDRLPAEQLAVTAPSERVAGEPGAMRITSRDCRAGVDEGRLRKRIVAIAVQEWGFFGFSVLDLTAVSGDDRRRRRASWRRFSRFDRAEAARVAGSIAGYWSATSDGSWILSRQNDIWDGPAGVAARWRDPWSAAFISWVMCESGLGSEERFRRHVAHHVYLDQAIEARDDPESAAAFVAHDVGEREVEPGDMVCRARRSAYQSVAERRADIGVGIRSHCDIVVKVEPERERVLTIGGNVRGSVRLKLFPATFEARGGAQVPSSIGRGRRTIFAHLKLRAPSVEGEVFESTPTLRALSERDDMLLVLERRLQGETRQAEERSITSGAVLTSP